MAFDYSDYEFLKVDIAERVATITINRPESLNAVNNAMHHELEQIWLDVRADQDVNAIILTGAGRAFCAGGDVKGMAAGSLAGSTGKKGKGRGRGPIAAANGRRLVENMLDVEQRVAKRAHMCGLESREIAARDDDILDLWMGANVIESG